MLLTELTRKHGLKVANASRFSVDECAVAVAAVVGPQSVKSAARMSGSVVLFLDSVEKVNSVVEKGIIINDGLVSVSPLTQPAKKVTLSNIPPFISDELLRGELSRHGKIVSPIKKLPSGCKQPELRHVVSHRRQVYMILNNKDEDLNLVLKLKIDGFEYVLFVTSETMKCFGCGSEGHLIRACPAKTASAAGDNTGGGEDNDGGDGPEAEGDQEGSQKENGEHEVRQEQGGNEHGRRTDSKEAEPSKDGGRENVSETDEPIRAEAQIDTVETPSEIEKDGATEMEVCADNLATESAAAKLKVGVDNGNDFNLTSGEKRKSKVSVSSSQEKLGSAKKARSKELSNWKTPDSDHSEIEDSPPGSDTDVSDDDSSHSHCSSQKPKVYSVDRIKLFLLRTKNVKGVKVTDYFSNKELFVSSVRGQMKNRGKGGYTDQEIYRLKRLVAKVSHELRDDDGGAL